MQLLFHKLPIAIVLMLTISTVLGAQQIKSMDFKNQDIKDIFLVLAENNNVSIIPDETVDGKASYYFANMDFEQALKVFCSTYNLYFSKEDNIYYISKVSFVQDKKTSLIDLKTAEVPVKSLIKILAARSQKTILFDSLPNENISLTLQNTALDDILKVVTTKYSDFFLDIKDNVYYIKRKAADGSSKSTASGITRNGSLYTVKAEKQKLKDLLNELFAQAKKDFIYLIEKDVTIDSILSKDKTFDETLRILLLQGGADYTLKEDLYYVVEVAKKDLIKRFISSYTINLQYISATEFIKLLPTTLNSNNIIKIDEKSNRIVATGSPEELAPVLDFIKLVDKAGDSLKTVRFDLNFLKTDELTPLMPPDFSGFPILPLPSKSSFLINLPQNKLESLKSFLLTIDKPTLSTPIILKYIKSDDLVAKLPPSITESNIVKTNDPAKVFFKGTDSLRKHFLQELANIDVPKPQIRYDVLVLHYDEGIDLGTGASTKFDQSKSTDTNQVNGELSKLFNLNFDIVNGLGMTFSTALNAKLNNNEARVLADTSLNGVNGEKISFQNTTTVRVRDTEIDPVTKQPTQSGTVREFSSGLIITIDGWVSGAQMITMKIDATLSKKIDGGGSGASLPGSSEKKLSTTVRTTNGKPFILGGLKQEDVSYDVQKTPLLGDIPLLGLLFQERSEKVTTNEFAIYIIPHVDYAEKGPDLETALIEELYAIHGKNM